MPSAVLPTHCLEVAKGTTAPRSRLYTRGRKLRQPPGRPALGRDALCGLEPTASSETPAPETCQALPPASTWSRAGVGSGAVPGTDPVHQPSGPVLGLPASTWREPGSWLCPPFAIWPLPAPTRGWEDTPALKQALLVVGRCHLPSQDQVAAPVSLPLLSGAASEGSGAWSGHYGQKDGVGHLPIQLWDHRRAWVSPSSGLGINSCSSL